MKNVPKAKCPACYRDYDCERLIEKAEEQIEKLHGEGEYGMTIETLFENTLKWGPWDGAIPFPDLCPECQAARDRGDVFIVPEETEGLMKMIRAISLISDMEEAGMKIPEDIAKRATFGSFDLWFGPNRVPCYIQLTRGQFMEYMDDKAKREDADVEPIRRSVLAEDSTGILPQMVSELVDGGLWDDDTHGMALGKMMTKRREMAQEAGGK